MKRGFECQDGSNASTPSSGIAKFAKPIPSVAKRAKTLGTLGIRGYCNTPVLPPPGVLQNETPGTLKPTPKDVSFTSVGRRFGGLGINTPRDGQLASDLRMDSNVSSTVVLIESQVSSGAVCLPANEEEDEFVLYTQVEYVRASQAAGTPGAQNTTPHNHDTQAACSIAVSLSALCGGGLNMQQRQLSQRDAGAADLHRGCMEEDEHQADSQALISSLPDRHLIPAVSAHRHGQAPSTDTHAATPELNGFSGGGHDESKTDEPMSIIANPVPTRMFNMFAPKDMQRYVIYIRHGESEYNQAMAEGKDFKDPMIFDPSLTARGIIQARDLRAKLLQKLSTHGKALWVVSPLRRAIETFLVACPLLPEGACTSSPAARSSSKGDGVDRRQLPADMRVEVLPLISEFLVTAGDVGSTTSKLVQEFPQMESSLQKIPEQWWFQAPRKANCAAQKQLNSLEPKEHRQRRLSELSRWLTSRPEKFIIMIGHSAFWHEFRGKSEKRMYNGEMRSMRW